MANGSNTAVPVPAEVLDTPYRVPGAPR